MRRMLLGSSIIMGAFLLGVISPRDAAAIPAFARKYKTSCMTCHAPFPTLTAVGEAFRLNGYKLPEADELYVKEQPVSMGAEPYKKVFPEAIWPSDIPGVPPISLFITGGANVDTGGTSKNHTAFNFPAELSVLGAGTFGRDFSFFAQAAFEKDEGGDTSTETLAWLMWQDLFGGLLGKNHLNIKAGNVGRHTIALPNTRNENSFTIESYLYADELGLETQPGFEVNGFGGRWRYFGGVVQESTDYSQKDYYAGLAFKIGGLGFDGSGGKSEEGGLSTTPSGFWRDDSILFGLFAYRGHSGENASDFDRMGGDVRLNYKDLSLAGGYIVGREEVTHIDKHIWFGEAYYFVFPWLIPYARFENLSATGADNLDKARFILGLAGLIRANIRFNAEGRFYTKNQPREAAGESLHDDDRVAFFLSWAF
jgi:hypothetical protein